MGNEQLKSAYERKMDEIHRIEEELDNQRKKKTQIEANIANLEKQLDNLKGNLSNLN